jgi:hypothetical protein
MVVTRATQRSFPTLGWDGLLPLNIQGVGYAFCLFFPCSLFPVPYSLSNQNRI